MDLVLAEKAIIARLKDQLNTSVASDFDVPYIQSFPENPPEHFESLSPDGEILVHFSRQLASIPEPKRTSEIIQDINLEWELWLIYPELVEHSAAYPWLTAIKNALNGWTLTYTDQGSTTTWDDSSPLFMTDVELVLQLGGIWYYRMNFQHIIEEK